MILANQKLALFSNTPFLTDVLEGFAMAPKRVPSRWLYDDEGSRLFSEITQLDEYYLTRKEHEILDRNAREISDFLLEEPLRLVELGAGDGQKTQTILRALNSHGKRFEYSPVDISSGELRALCSQLSSRFENMHCDPVYGDNAEGLVRVARQRKRDERLCVMYLGSSIGNCAPAEVEGFLAFMRSCMREGDLAFIGFDLIKDSSRLISAYDDSLGVTKAFNFNLLHRMNREIGADFDVGAYRHEATWNPTIRGMESWLVSLKDQTVTIGALGRSYRIRKWEPIRTEISLKFDPAELTAMARRHGFDEVAQYIDDDGDFADVVWKASHPGTLSH